MRQAGVERDCPRDGKERLHLDNLPLDLLGQCVTRPPRPRLCL